MTIHDNIEEELFYPALIERPKARDIVLEAMEQHRLVLSKEQLEELGSRLEATKAEQLQDAMPERDQIEL